MDSSSSSTPESDGQPPDDFRSTNEKGSDNEIKNTRYSSNVTCHSQSKDEEDDKDNRNFDCCSDHVDKCSPNGNTSAGVIRLSLLALSAAIQAVEDIDSEGLTAWMSCPLRKHYVIKTVNARRAVIKIQNFYWEHVHQRSLKVDDYCRYFFSTFGDYNAYDTDVSYSTFGDYNAYDTDVSY
jgi:hypothetical protein